MADVWPIGLSSVWPGKEWRIQWNISLHLVETIQHQQCQKPLVFAGAWPGGKDALMKGADELWGRRTGFKFQLRGIEQFSGDNVCESTWLSVFHTEII